MKLATKLTSTILGGVLMLMAIEGYVSMRRSVSLFDQEMEEHALLLGHALRPVVVDAWIRGGEQRAREALAESSEGEPSLEMSFVLGERVRDELAWLDGSQLSALERREDVSVKHQVDGRGVRSTFVPVSLSESSLGVIELTESLSPLTLYRRESMLQTLALVMLSALLSILAVRALGVNLVGRPLQVLVGKARRVGAGDLSEPVELGGNDELQELASALNRMCEDLATARAEAQAEHVAKVSAVEQARHRDRLHALGELAAGVAHELGTPLNVIAGRAEMIAQGGRPADKTTEFAEIIKAQASRMDGIIRDLLQFGRGRAAARAPTRLDELAQGVIAIMASIATEHGVDLDLSSEPVPDIEADQAQIQQVITNLVLNAVHASPRGARVEVRVEHLASTAAAGSEEVRLTVEDFGEGMTKDTMDRLFDPFFTTKGVGSGTGLGLSISHGIVVDHGGRIDVTSERGQGSRFDIHFPVSS